MDMRTEDDVAFSTSYVLKRDDKTWAEAEAVCKSEGGHLASIHSKDQQALAKKAADVVVYSDAWLGGRREKDAKWRWSDNSIWDFTNWASGYGNTDDRCLRMRVWMDGRNWNAVQSYYRSRPLCQGKIAVSKEKGLTRIEMKKAQLKFFPFYITFKSPAVGKQFDKFIK